MIIVRAATLNAFLVMCARQFVRHIGLALVEHPVVLQTGGGDHTMRGSSGRQITLVVSSYPTNTSIMQYTQPVGITSGGPISKYPQLIAYATHALAGVRDQIASASYDGDCPMDVIDDVLFTDTVLGVRMISLTMLDQKPTSTPVPPQDNQDGGDYVFQPNP